MGTLLNNSIWCVAEDCLLWYVRPPCLRNTLILLVQSADGVVVLVMGRLESHVHGLYDIWGRYRAFGDSIGRLILMHGAKLFHSSLQTGRMAVDCA